MAVEGDQALRRARRTLALAREALARGVDGRARRRGQRRGVEVRGLGLDLVAQRGQRVGGVEQRGARGGVGRQRQRVDRGEGVGDGIQILGQARAAAHDLFDQQRAVRQRRAHRQQAVHARHVAAGGRAPVARGFVGQVVCRAQAHLAVLGHAGEHAARAQAHVVVGEALVVQQLQRRVGQRRARFAQRLAQGDEQRVVGEGHGR